jgi:amino-acid N-acetyltransferase
VSEEPEINIREAAASDVRQLYVFLQPFFAERRLLERSAEELLKLLQHGFIAERDSVIVGFASIEVYSWKMAEIQCLAVSPVCRGRGLGKLLIHRCVQRARTLNIHELMAITSSEKPFTDCGFHYSLPDQKRALFIYPQQEGLR